ncbi:ParB N-terminal domain-containing protein [Streptomyces sp. NPDC049577]|uniref:ParB/RepB/Spo0J family partition protein n=1 Tax=Streptomyces sp. NPDC049577 TaxID=3155153 RepID=UPI0034415645
MTAPVYGVLTPKPPHAPAPRLDRARPLRPAPLPARGRIVVIRIALLHLTGSPRLGGQDPEHVRALAKTDPALLPPIVVHRSTLRVLDGVHRVRAAQLRGATTIRAEFFEGTEEESFVHAVRANTSHGLPLSLADRKAAAARILTTYPEWSDRSIGAAAGLSGKTVAVIRRRSAEENPRLNETDRLGRDGRIHPVSAIEGRIVAGRLLNERPHASLREIAHSAGISLGTAQDVRRRLEKGEDPVPSRRRPARPAAEPPAVPPAPPAAPPAGGAAPPSRTRAASGDRPPPSLARLRTLRQDPSLRSTDTGRALLRLLCAHDLSLANWDAIVGSVPPHCVDAMVDVANECARVWQAFARDVARRDHGA